MGLQIFVAYKDDAAFQSQMPPERSLKIDEAQSVKVAGKFLGSQKDRAVESKLS